MVNGIPIVTMTRTEGFINASDEAQDSLFAFCTTATRGPVLEPTLITSNTEARKVFNLDLQAHFAQGTSSILVCRVAPGGKNSMKQAEKNFYAVEYTKDSQESVTKYTLLRDFEVQNEKPVATFHDAGKADIKFQKVLGIKAKNPGSSSISDVNITKVYNKYVLTIILDGVNTYTSRHSNISGVANKINNSFSDYLIAEYIKEPKKVAPNGSSAADLWQYEDIENIDIISSSEKPIEGQVFQSSSGQGSDEEKDIVKDVTSALNNYTPYVEGSNGKLGYYKNQTERTEFTATNLDVDIDSKDHKTPITNTGTEGVYKLRDTKTGKINNDITDSLNIIDITDLKANRNDTAMDAYEQAFRTLETRDVFGVVVNEDNTYIRDALIAHIQEMNDPEVNMVRLGATSLLLEDMIRTTEDSDEEYQVIIKDSTVSEGYKIKTKWKKDYDIDKVATVAEEINDEYMVFIGQGVEFKKQIVDESTHKKINKTVELSPLECVQLYTGKRSVLKYHNAIFGGEDKKILTNVSNVLPVGTDAETIPSIDDYVKLNQAGVLAFKKEYDNVTFVEGVTTHQTEGPLQYENIVSIVIYTSKKLVEACKPYMGQNVSQDLRSSLKTKLEDVLETIRKTDNSLIGIEGYNIPPYAVEVTLGAFVSKNEFGELVRQNKISVRAKIVPAGALREIELGVIII